MIQHAKPNMASIYTLIPILHPEVYVFCIVQNTDQIPIKDIIMAFKEQEGITLILKKVTADLFRLDYTYEAAWITLSIQTSLHMIGLTALFSAALTQANISCNVVAAYHHDHIFVDIKDADEAMQILSNLNFA